MLASLREAVIASVRRRHAEDSDCPVEPQQPQEMVELALLDLADASPDSGEAVKAEVVRDMDVPKGAWAWIEAIAAKLTGPHLRIETPRDAETIALWHDEQPVAVVLNLRDQHNHSIQFRAPLRSARPSPSPAIVKEAGEVERLLSDLARHAEALYHDVSQSDLWSTLVAARAALSASNAAQVSK